MMPVRMQVMPLENGLTRVLDLASKLWALYDSESGVYQTGFYFAEVLEDISGIEQVIEQSDLEVCQ
jgi:hypothetical protein